MSTSELEAGLSADPEDEIVRAELEEAQKKRRTGRVRIIGIVLSVVVVGGVFIFVLPRIANYGDVWDVVQTLSWQWLVALSLATLLNLATYGPPLDGGAPRPLVLPGHARHPRIDRALRRRPGRRRRRDGDLVRDAARLGLRGPPGRAGRRRPERLEPVRDPRLSDPRRRRPRRRGRTATGRSSSSRSIGLVVFAAIVAGVRDRSLERAARAARRRPRRPTRDPGEGPDPQGARQVERHVVRPLPRRRRSS